MGTTRTIKGLENLREDGIEAVLAEVRLGRMASDSAHHVLTTTFYVDPDEAAERINAIIDPIDQKSMR